MKIRLFPGLGLLCLAAAGAAAHEFSLGELVIEHPYSPATPQMARAGAGYMTIRNTGATADALTGVQADFARAGLHATEVDAAGVARMSEIERIEIPPGGSVTLEPQGLHVMFVGLTGPLADGDKLDAVLTFEQAGEIAVQFNVEARQEGEAAEHEDH